MLSIQPLKSAQGAANYYAAAFNYYAGDALAMRWLGKGAEMLGLNGVVEKEKMLALLEGRLPNGQILQNKKGEHRPGFDMTFSAPKSVSILVGLGFDKELELFHDKAVELTINHLEQEFAETRVVKDGKVHFQKTNNFVIAAFRQPSSRANDPALHTHSVTLNMTLDELGKARSLASDIHANRGVVEQLQRSVKYCGLLYRTHLANMLKEKGYQLVDAGDGLFEIAGMPEAVLKEFSRRREDIENYMKEQGWSGASAASAATLLTRDDKEEHDIAVLQADWMKRIEALGFDGHQFVKDALVNSEKKGLFDTFKEFVFGQFYVKEELEHHKACEVARVTLEAVEVAIETVSQKSSVFTLRQLKEYALKHSLTTHQIVGIDAIDRVINEKIKNQTLYTGIDPQTMQTVLTTPWQLTLETESLARIENNKGAVSSITTKKNVLDFQANYEACAKFPLTASQKQAMVQFLTNNDRYMAIQGYAGVGKTTMLKLTGEIARASGFELRGITVTSTAAIELNGKGGIKADVFPIVHGELLRAEKGCFEKTIFIVDEASMLSSPQGHELIKLIEQKGARLYLVGDDSQFHSVKNGRIFGLTQQYGIQTAEMTDNIRQLNQPLKEAVHHAIDGDIYDALNKINEVREFKTHDERILHVANCYLHLSSHVREHTLLFAPTHANRQEITSIIRAGLKKEGAISQNDTLHTVLKPKMLEEAQLYYAQYYTKGDVLRFNHESKRFGINKGEYLTVSMVSPANKRDNTLVLERENGNKITFRLNELPKYKSTRAGFSRHIEVYKPESLEIADGDRILWTRNFKQDGIVNSERAVITALTETEVTLVLDSGEKKTMDRKHPALSHIDHGYVFTTIKVQGKDKMYGIGLIESGNKFSASLRNFYVQISRSIFNMTLVTDSKNQLIRALEENDDTNKSAIDFVSTSKLIHHQEQFSAHEKSINIDEVIGKKILKEAAFDNGLARIEAYRQAKESKNSIQSAKMAYNIIQDAKLYQLAKKTLGYGYQEYRSDALVMATLKFGKSVSAEEKDYLHTVKAYVTASIDAKNAWKQALEINPTVSNKQHAFQVACKRNELAFKIAGNINAYKPGLKHYSIGELNRLGLPQHRYQQEEEKSVLKLEKLTKEAAIHQIHSNIYTFFSTDVINKPAVAFEIKTHSKMAHPCLVQLARVKNIPIEALWKEINFAAKQQADLLFKQSLSEPAQKAFDKINHYRELSFEIGKLWKDSLTSLEKKEPLPNAVEECINKTSVLRNEIATLIIQDDTCKPILHYFKMNHDKLTLQASRHQQRENVVLFLKSGGHFANKLDAAERISQDIKGHYPFIKECGVNTRQLNQYVRFVTRQNGNSNLSEVEISNSKHVLQYKYESKHAALAWKKIFSLKGKSVKPARYLVNQAMESTAKRDVLASRLANNPHYAALLIQEKISLEKLETQSSNHHMRVHQIKTLNEERLKLLGRLGENVERMSREECKQWYQAWNTLGQQENKVLFSGKLYQEILKDNPLIATKLSENQKGLLEKYELDVRKTFNQTDRKAAPEASQFIDLTITNETLIANPESTYKAIFGEPKSMTSKEMRYSGGLIVSLKGSKSGFWFDFGSGAGGSPIQAIMREQGVDFKEALVIAAELAGTKNITQYIPETKPVKQTLIDDKRELKNKIMSARSIVKGAVPIENTLAARYLSEHRNITSPERLDMKFWPKFAKWMALDDKGNLMEKINKIPALIIPAKNEKGDITGVQRIYLDEKTANKNTFMETAKLSQGQIKSSAGVMQKGCKFGTVYLAEGPETGASIAMADPKATVLVSFGLSNIQNLGKIIKSFFPARVIIGGDSDKQPESKTFEITQNAQNILKEEGINAEIIIPRQIQNLEKTDWNDVLKLQGLSEVRKQLGIVIPLQKELLHSQKEIDHLTMVNSENQMKQVAKSNETLQNSYSEITRGQGMLPTSLDRSIQTKISEYSKNKITPVEHKGMDTKIISKHEPSLEM